ncbi:TrmH family RNA methyltransferase [Croceicoccus bisphenolivorans]|uniref:TrmH family RNA methyltransferase n=1 Tax=Croceicoccus bisphenolivorans TaxID=1783232 RepID=UPI0008337F37|nr:RNA methyltransferase [Croceicoccus bisphenolivorans]
MRRITGLSNPTVKSLRALRDKKHRRRERRFLAEGLRLLTDARETGHLPAMLAMAEGRERHPLLDALIADVEAADGDVVELSEAALAKITGKDNPQAVCGVFEEFDTALSGIDRKSAPLFLVAQAMRDPGNLGTMLRTADAVGAGGVILIDDCADPFSVEAVRASMGAIFTVPLAQARWEEFRDWLRSGAGQLVAASLRESHDYRKAPYAAPCFVMVGNESRGLPEDYEAECDLRVHMPMLGRADSLNAAVAAAVLGYEVLAAVG